MMVIITFTFCCDNLWKGSLWLWKSLESSGNFFLLLCGHPDILMLLSHCCLLSADLLLKRLEMMMTWWKEHERQAC